MEKEKILKLLRSVYNAGYQGIGHVAAANYREREIEAISRLSEAFDNAEQAIEEFSKNPENRDNQQGQIEVINLNYFGKQTTDNKLAVLAVNIKRIQEHLNKPSETTKEFPKSQPYEKKFLCTQERITKKTGNVSFTKGEIYIGDYFYGNHAWLSLKNNQGYTVLVKNIGFREMV